MLTGRAAFGGATLTDTLAAIVQREPRSGPHCRLPRHRPSIVFCGDVSRRIPRAVFAMLVTRWIDITDAMAAPGSETIAVSDSSDAPLRRGAWRHSPSRWRRLRARSP